VFSLDDVPRRGGLSFEAVKSYIGHTELAAGVMGLMRPLTGLVRGWTTQILHLAVLNPHVGTVLTAAAVGSIIAPRQDQARVNTTRRNSSSSLSFAADGRTDVPTRQSAGASSFSFQGTNVHAVLTVADDGRGEGEGRLAVTAGSGTRSMTAMDRIRYWPAVRSHPLVTRALRTNAAACTSVLQMLLEPRALPIMWDSRILGESVFSPAGLIEAGFAAVKAWSHNGGETDAGSLNGRIAATGLTRCAMQSPLVLPSRCSAPSSSSSPVYSSSTASSSSSPLSAVLEITWRHSTGGGEDGGDIDIVSVGQGRSWSRHRGHMSARVAAIVPVSSATTATEMKDGTARLRVHLGSSVSSGGSDHHREGGGHPHNYNGHHVVMGTVSFGASNSSEGSPDEYHTHPVALDCTLQLSGAAAASTSDYGETGRIGGVGTGARALRPRVVSAVEGYVGTSCGEGGGRRGAGTYRASAHGTGQSSGCSSSHRLIGVAQLVGVTTCEAAAAAGAIPNKINFVGESEPLEENAWSVIQEQVENKEEEIHAEKDGDEGEDGEGDLEVETVALLIIEDVQVIVHGEEMDDGDDGNGGGGGGGGGNGGGQRPVIDLDTNLLELGLDSMTMFELHHMLERRVGQRISAKVLMENQTPRAMAAALVGKFGSTLGMEAPSSSSGSSTTRSAFSSVDASISSLASSDEPETKVAASQKTSRPGCRKLSRARQWEQRRQHLQRDRHSTLPSSRRGLSNGGDDDDIGVTCGCFFPFRSPSRR